MLVELILWIPDSLVLVRHVVRSSIHRRSLCFSERRFSPVAVFSFFVGLFFEKADFFSLVRYMAQKTSVHIFLLLFPVLHSRKNEAFFLLFVGRDLSTAIIEFSSHLLDRSCPFVHLDLFNWHLLSVALPDGFSSTYASFLFIRSFSELVPS